MNRRILLKEPLKHKIKRVPASSDIEKEGVLGQVYTDSYDSFVTNTYTVLSNINELMLLN